MTTKEEEPKEIQENENVNQEEEAEKEEEEEEPVDLELQKEMKGLKISDSDYIKEPKIKIVFVRVLDNKAIKVKIPCSLRKNKLY